MQLADRTGIKCDLCGMEFKTSFTYYSIDMKLTQVRHQSRDESEIVVFSADACAACMAELGELVKKHYKPTKVGICCDLTGKILVGAYDYYPAQITKVVVKLSADPNQPAIVTTDPDYLAINLSEEAYKLLLKRSVDIRATNWTSKA